MPSFFVFLASLVFVGGSAVASTARGFYAYALDSGSFSVSRFGVTLAVLLLPFGLAFACAWYFRCAPCICCRAGSAGDEVGGNAHSGRMTTPAAKTEIEMQLGEPKSKKGMQGIGSHKATRFSGIECVNLSSSDGESTNSAGVPRSRKPTAPYGGMASYKSAKSERSRCSEGRKFRADRQSKFSPDIVERDVVRVHTTKISRTTTRGHTCSPRSTPKALGDGRPRFFGDPPLDPLSRATGKSPGADCFDSSSGPEFQLLCASLLGLPNAASDLPPPPTGTVLPWQSAMAGRITETGKEDPKGQ